MNDIEQPLLPSSDAMASAPGPDASTSTDQTRKPLPVLDETVIDQMRAILTNAGVTASMINLPDDEDVSNARGPDTAETPSVSFDDNSDVETGAISSVRRTLNNMALKRSHSIKNTTEEYNLAEGIYSMFFLSKNWSLPFWYALLTALTKLTLYVIVIYWIYMPGGWREEQIALGKTPPIVQATQFLLIPAAIGITEELMITMDVLGKRSWQKIESHPQATQVKFWMATTFRALDGVTWLFIIVTLMLYAVDVLGMFLNFAALQFLQDIDNAAFEMAKNGYLSSSLERLANDVCKTTLPSHRTSWREYMDTVALITIWILVVIAWALVNFYDKDG